MVRCSHCGHDQWLDWVKVGEEDGDTDHCLVDAINKLFVCGKCKGALTDEDRFHGHWVAKFPDRSISGYWMSQMNYIKHSPESMLRKEAKMSKQNFYNFNLGKSYRGTDVVADRSIIIKNLSPGVNTGKRWALGVDNGIIKHFVLGNEAGITRIGKTKDWSDIEALIKEYKPVTVIDGNPYPVEPKKLSEKYSDVYIAFYKKDRDMKDSLEWKRGLVRIQRTKYFDILVDKFVQQQKIINLSAKEVEEYLKHWETLSRQDSQDALGVTHGEWVSSTGEDHFAHATVYQDVALSKILRGDSYVAAGSGNQITAEQGVEVDDRLSSALPSLQELIKSAQDLS
jgi:hypothetical protein